VENAHFTIKLMEVRNMAQPEKKFKAGNCEAAVFENELTRDGQTVFVKKVAIQKSYKDKNDEWKSTHSLDKNDVPKMMLALFKAYEYVTLKEDKPNEVAVETL
jgi:hypothetical protein